MSLLATGVLLAPALLAFLPPASAAASPSGMPWGMNVPAIGPLTEMGAKPDYAMTWVGIWNRDSWSSVENALRTMKNAGVTPVIQWYYWGDDISPTCVENGCYSSLHGGSKSRADWTSMAKKLASVVSTQMAGKPVIIVLETEFNKGGIDGTYAPTFDRYLAEQAAIFDAVSGVKLVVGFGSWSSDKWTRFDDAVAAADFVGFQALRSSVRQTKEQYLGVVDHVLATAGRMNDKFPGKAVFVTDLAFSSYPEPEWAGYQRDVIKSIWARVGELQARNVKGLMYRSLDDVQMDTANHHGQAERWWGLRHQDDSPKPSLKAWLDGVGAVPPPPPPGKPVPGTLEAEAMKATVGGRQTDSKASGGYAWNMWSNGDLTQWVEASATGTYEFEVRARGSSAAGGWPILTAYVGDTKVASFTVGTSSYSVDRFEASLTGAQSTRLRLVYANDHRTSTEDRNVIVDRVTVVASNAPPVASFSAATNGLEVRVDASASSDPNGDPISYAWSFGDGSTGSGVAATHAFAAAGTYTVTLTATAGGASSKATRSVTVAKPAYTPGTMEAEDFAEKTKGGRYSDSKASGGAGWNLWSNGEIRQPIAVGTSGYYIATVTARGSPAGGVDARMEIRLEGATLAAFDVPPGYGKYAVRLELPANAPRTLAVAFTNDGRTSTEDRNLLVDVVTLAPAAGPQQKEAESFAVRSVGGRTTDAKASGGAAWNLWTNGHVADAVTVDAVGTYHLVVRAKGTVASGEWPEMALEVDGRRVATWRVSSSTWTPYAIEVPLSAGKHDVRVLFTNDHRDAATGQDRNLHVDVLRWRVA